MATSHNNDRMGQQQEETKCGWKNKRYKVFKCVTDIINIWSKYKLKSRCNAHSPTGNAWNCIHDCEHV